MLCVPRGGCLKRSCYNLPPSYLQPTSQLSTTYLPAIYNLPPSYLSKPRGWGLGRLVEGGGGARAVKFIQNLALEANQTWSGGQVLVHFACD